MTIGRYTKKPVTVDAFQWPIWTALPPRDRLANFPQWFRNAVDEGFVTIESNPRYRAVVRQERGSIDYVNDGDWVIRGVEGEIYSCPDTVFKATYELEELSVRGGATGPAKGVS